MNLKLGQLGDIEGVLALQAQYLLANTPENERAGGFVTTPFTPEQLTEIINLAGMFVAEEQGEIVAYTFAAAWDYFAQWAIFPYMLSRLPSLSFDNQILSSENTFQYGPICVHSAYRGTGLFQQLFETMRMAMQAKYPIGITFINQINQRSYQAHTQKLQMQVIDEFSFNQNNYYGLAFYTHLSVLPELSGIKSKDR
ncbi:MAG: GNAT family acetyltransferase [Microscillaceae bacterium]|jgi:GNAT superfamily N-acetyltransferase|nr:GNAT family acetyltransferase [Microscillaceae bacterium]